MNTHTPEDEKQSLPEGAPEDREELSRGEVTQLLLDWNNGDAAAWDRLAPLVYGELRRMAHRLLLGERVGHSMQTGALVNEVYLRLFDGNGAPCRNRFEFTSPRLGSRVRRVFPCDEKSSLPRPSSRCGQRSPDGPLRRRSDPCNSQSVPIPL